MDRVLVKNEDLYHRILRRRRYKDMKKKFKKPVFKKENMGVVKKSYYQLD